MIQDQRKDGQNMLAPPGNQTAAGENKSQSKSDAL
jgi:hypothetical protein